MSDTLHPDRIGETYGQRSRHSIRGTVDTELSEDLVDVSHYLLRRVSRNVSQIIRDKWVRYLAELVVREEWIPTVGRGYGP